ncbi:MAG: glycerol-3-phosphate dehydrogenase/oxidase [Deltaproteobacteria bacterium]|nr:glycerol-3-phosphate dehydrogenase/oxidase [Deltaproteobacteria bacterium]
MNRDEMLNRISEKGFTWDFAVTGGGATGMGIAVEAASRGYSVVLFEQDDFGAATSSRSTKLVHGGVRYLKQGNISLVLEALKERGILRRNAPHLVKSQAFIVPTYDWWEGPFYGIGLKLYDLMAGEGGFGHSEILGRDEVLAQIPNIETDGLNGGVKYYDGQFDDSRMVINLAQTAVEQGGVVLNYMKVEKLIKSNNVLCGLVAHDLVSDREYEIKARAIINATGVFTDSIRKLDEPESVPVIQPSQGIHIVLDKTFLKGDAAIMVPRTADGRIIFAVPWQDRVIVGTTDTPVAEIDIDPLPMEHEVDFILENIARYLSKDPEKKDILSVFAGLRPLVSPGKNSDTANISREHMILVSRSGLVTIAGGKWTTYRKMAEAVVDQAIINSQIEFQPSVSETLQIHGYHNHADRFGNLACYGSDALQIQCLVQSNPDLGNFIFKDSIISAEVIWAVENEMAVTVEDFLSRRRRALILDARSAVDAAPVVAKLMAKELKKNKKWQKEQVEAFSAKARKYII